MGRHPAPPCLAGALVRAALKRRKITHRAAAAQLGIDHGRLSRICSGSASPTLREALALRDLLRVPVDSWSA
jgi:transcriptional regulator with XRE-family HTH domain